MHIVYLCKLMLNVCLFCRKIICTFYARKRAAIKENEIQNKIEETECEQNLYPK